MDLALFFGDSCIKIMFAFMGRDINRVRRGLGIVYFTRGKTGHTKGGDLQVPLMGGRNKKRP